MVPELKIKQNNQSKLNKMWNKLKMSKITQSKYKKCVVNAK